MQALQAWGSGGPPDGTLRQGSPRLAGPVSQPAALPHTWGTHHRRRTGAAAFSTSSRLLGAANPHHLCSRLAPLVSAAVVDTTVLVIIQWHCPPKFQLLQQASVFAWCATAINSHSRAAELACLMLLAAIMHFVKKVEHGTLGTMPFPVLYFAPVRCRPVLYSPSTCTSQHRAQPLIRPLLCVGR